MADYLCLTVHEIKVARSNLLADLNKSDKRASYRFVSTQCWYVLVEGIARPHEILPEYGVIIATDNALDVSRPAPSQPRTPDFGTWMALARVTSTRPLGDPEPML